MTRLQQISLITGIVAIGLGAYVTFVQGDNAGIVAMALGAVAAALAPVMGGFGKGGPDAS